MRLKFSHKASVDSKSSTVVPTSDGVPKNLNNSDASSSTLQNPSSLPNLSIDNNISSISKPPRYPDDAHATIETVKYAQKMVNPKERLESLMKKDPLSWSSKEVADWIAFSFGLEQYRKKFVHHAVSGALLPKLTMAVLQHELGIKNFGHREIILTSISSLISDRNGGSPDTSSSLSLTSSRAPLSPTPGHRSEIVRAQERSVKIAHELGKAQSRAAHLGTVVERAQRNRDIATKEVERLEAALKEAEYQASGGKAMKIATSNSLNPTTASADGTTFMERLQADLTRRKSSKKKKQAKLKNTENRNSNNGYGTTSSFDTLSSCIDYLKYVIKEKNLAIVFEVPTPAEEDNEKDEINSAAILKSIDDIIEPLGNELGTMISLDIQSVALETTNAFVKAQKLCIAVRKALFMQRLQEDLESRKNRRKEIEKEAREKRAAAAKAAEDKDRQEAIQTFAELGWSEESLRSDSAGEELIAALLRRAKAVQAAKEAGKSVDWEPFRSDGLLALIESKAQPAQQKDISDQIVTTSAQGPQVLTETVTLLSNCRKEELEKLEGLRGQQKLLKTFRWLRAQEFIRSSEEKQKAKKSKLRSMEYKRSPRKRLPKEQEEAFLQRLAEDAARRARNKEELRAKAVEDENARYQIPTTVVKGKSKNTSTN